MDATLKPWRDDIWKGVTWMQTSGVWQALRSYAPVSTPRASRLPFLDAARGIAILAMATYHFSWDLNYFGYITVDVTEELGWRIFARLIAGSFLFIVGVSLALAARNGIDRGRYLRRLGAVVAAALAITVVTRFVLPDSYIFFGILHHIALASVLALAFVRAPILVTAAAAVACFLANPLLSRPFFDQPALIWLGLGTYFPHTNDFVPVFPWFGVVLAGMAVMRLLIRLSPQRPFGGLGRFGPRPLAFAGRHSLIIYLVHQPVLFALVYAASVVSPPSLLGYEPSFIESCAIGCVDPQGKPGTCRRACTCVAHRLQEEGLWQHAMRMDMTPAQETRYYDISDQCHARAAE